MKSETLKFYEQLFNRYPALSCCKDSVMKAYEILIETYQKGGKLMCCGNGGSSSDSEHIVGELLKKFRKHRNIDKNLYDALNNYGEIGQDLQSKLEGSLPAISLVSQSGIITAFANDVSWDYAFAQQLSGLGNKGDSLIALSTSGNSLNCVSAVIVAKCKGIKTVGMTGEKGGKLKEICDVCICVPASVTADIQEYHLPIYHCLCSMLESELFD